MSNVVEHPVVEHPVVEHPVVEHPVVEHPVVEHPSAVSPESPVLPERGARVLCAISGGVDSSYSAALLKRQGFDVLGAMMRFWQDDRPKEQFSACCSPEAAYDARRVADAIDVPFYLIDYRDTFEEVVIDPFLRIYQQGNTPNPCVWCNRQIKFGAFLTKAQMLGCDYLATGHYVRRVDYPGDHPDGHPGDHPNKVALHRGRDDSKDQTYFLWALPREVLPRLLFPLGELSKSEVRQRAHESGFKTAHKASSHSLCFITSSVKDFLQERTARHPGPIVDAADGYKEIGRHDGVQFYTIGQRKGLGLYHSHLERFVLALRADSNTVVVGTRAMCHYSRLEADQANFHVAPSELPTRVLAQTRYRQVAAPATLTLTGPDTFTLCFDEPMFAITTGQSAVIYDGDRLLGGGVIRQRQ